MTMGGRARLLGVPRVPLLALVAANVLPLAGVLLLGWDLRSVMLLYWAENVVVGGWAIARMLTVGRLMALPRVAFFCLHFGGFMAGHLLFVYALTEAADWSSVEWHGSGFTWDTKPGTSSLPGIDFFAYLPWWALTALVASHGMSFFRNFIHGGESQHTSVSKEMFRPYPRVVVMHIALLAGAWAIALAGQPVALLAVLVLFKIIVDGAAHIREHRKAKKKAT